MPLKDPVPSVELLDLSFHRGDLTCQLDGLGVFATATAVIRGRRSSGVGDTAAIRGRRSSRGGSSPGLGSLACALPESQYGFESFDLLGTTHRARREEPAFPDLDVFLDVPELAAVAVVPYLPMHL